MAEDEPVGNDVGCLTVIGTLGLTENGDGDQVEHGRHDGGYRDGDQPPPEDVTGYGTIDAGQATGQADAQGVSGRDGHPQ